MDSLPRKRKGPKSSSLTGSHLSDARRTKKKCSRSPSPSPIPAAAVTAPIVGRASCVSPNRGLKRKLGCIDPSTRIGRRNRLDHSYALGREIGKGKFGSVRRCRSLATGELFACKSLAKADETVHREVEIMQHLSGHPGVVTLMAVYEDAEYYRLVMELCPGGRLLDQMAREGRYSEQRAANLLKELILVVKYCHEMGVVHRDIKPENILLTGSGKLKLADFGLAVRVTSGQRLSGLAGSPAYVAPEVLSGDYTEKVDIWGAGVLLHALLLGVLPFRGDSKEAVFEAIKTLKLDFHSGMWESISELARDLISGMLTRDVSRRFTADEVLRHPWILFYTECPSNVFPIEVSARNTCLTPRVLLAGTGITKGSSSLGSLSRRSEEQDEYGFVDALAAAISRVKISEPKRSRLCVPANPIQQQCSSNMKTNLCTAF